MVPGFIVVAVVHAGLDENKVQQREQWGIQQQFAKPGRHTFKVNGQCLVPLLLVGVALPPVGAVRLKWRVRTRRCVMWVPLMIFTLVVVCSLVPAAAGARRVRRCGGGGTTGVIRGRVAGGGEGGMME
jgi:uncharacterized membrane protein